MMITKAMEEVEQGLFNREFLDKWYSNYKKLEAFNKQKDSGAGYIDEELAQWVGIQQRIKYMLPGELKDKLAALHLNFEDNASSWEPMYRQLASFVKEKGHAYLPDDQKYEQLKDWQIRQILNKRLLSESQFQRLDDLGVDWEMPISRDHRWELMFSRLKDFHKTFGHSRVPQKWAKDKQLANWIGVQRRTHSQNKMRQDRERKLNTLGFVWHVQEQYDSQWEDFFQQLVSFHKKHGHYRVPGKYEKLVSWIERQRTSRTNNLLPAERERRLNDIGFTWSFKEIKKRSWEDKYRQLSAYRKRYGHSFVPVNYKENKSLGTWVASQRWLEAKGKLSAAKKKKLDELDFVWSKDTQLQLQSVYDTQWEASFEKLKTYRQEHGTCQVSLKVDRVLQRWTRWQRILFYQGKLSQERIDRLNEIRFPWSVQEGYWMRMYDALANYKKKFGHTRVPFRWAPNPQLAAWVYRVKKNKKELTPQKVELLNRIGFDWALRQRKVLPWKVMYERLVAFKKEYGHARVPVKWRKDPKLGKWVSRMRQERERLDSERVSLLEAVDFDWGRKFKSENSTQVAKEPFQ
ncbi:helicase associated domain-containing protein [Pontibacter silvestris]|uniref:Helicase associated domain-containing protein n=1 Tax=Pontibacter silvestris TaxID=2305183 RepID=A0ABW4WTW2_9BACT|nr:helicase associated domain-containing protein [Pontibacter silvestris]MCC9138143.1 helicase associated domain-containing protein [Pontibacter silvestris]